MCLLLLCGWGEQMGLAVYPRASFAWGVEGSFACACTANVPKAACGAKEWCDRYDSCT